ASFIKLTMDKKSVMCGRGEIPVYSDEHLRVIMEFARRQNLPTAGHIHTKFGFDRALQYGLDSIEHSIGDAELTDREVLAMVQKSIAIVPTLMIAQMYAAPEAYRELPAKYRTDFIAAEMVIRQQYLNELQDADIEPSIHQANRASLQNFQKYDCRNLYQKGKLMARPDLYFDILLAGPGNLQKMKRAGVLIGCGTDSGVPFIYHGTLWREMAMFSRIGFTNQEILQCATINNARILRLADKIGTVEKGKYADMVVLKENPLEKIEACRSPELVIKDGRVYDVTQKT
ncbi:MAG TPA: amidohydrolase family protein, partial [Smithellaceae bacterium]|nr:amidohydrolase family protein [Smithellaceae bacterium]